MNVESTKVEESFFEMKPYTFLEVQGPHPYFGRKKIKKDLHGDSTKR